MRTHVCVATFMVAMPLLSAPIVSAQAQQNRIRFAEMDANKDGRITRDEWRGSRQSFLVHDWNNDGELSGDEVRPAGRRPVNEDPDFTEGRLENQDWTARRFTRLDINQDSRIVRAEWPYDWQSFRRADRNRDNILTRTEFLSEDNIDDDRECGLSHCDLNGNGRIERSEWHGSNEAFAWLDRNRNNVLSYDELVDAESAEASDLFTRLDTNRNGRVELREWQWSRVSFDKRDQDNDGVLSRRELPASTTAANAGAVGTTGRTFVIDSQTRWNDTGINVRAGDYVRIDAQGTIQMSTDANDIADPWGARSGRRAANSPVPNMAAGGLIAMIGGATPVFVGNRTDTRVRMPATGRLYLGVNDDHLADNKGEFRVTITIER